MATLFTSVDDIIISTLSVTTTPKSLSSLLSAGANAKLAGQRVVQIEIQAGSVAVDLLDSDASGRSADKYTIAASGQKIIATTDGLNKIFLVAGSATTAQVLLHTIGN